MEKQVQKKKKETTFETREYIEDPITCITSTAEPTASFRFWISACKIKVKLSSNLNSTNIWAFDKLIFIYKN